MSADQPRPPVPTHIRVGERIDHELGRWRRIFSGDTFYYGEEPGPVARRAVRYHRPFLPHGGTALDAGCGEGQDLAFLAERGYAATGIEFTPEGAEKAARMLAERGLPGTVLCQDLRELDPAARFDLVLAVNAVQFLGADAPACLDRLMDAVSPGGVIGLSLFAREGSTPPVSGTIYFATMPELFARFRGWQRLEAAQLWQWNGATDEAQPFLTLIARKPPTLTRLETARREG